MTETSRRGSVRAAGLLSALAVAAALLGGCAVLPQAATDRESEWDPRVLEIARQVEHLRGLEFERPVTVRFLSPERFAASQQTGDDELTPSDRRDLAWMTSALQSMGLIGPDVDLLAVTNDSTGVVGYYDPGTGRITMPTGRITPAEKVTLAHELTHALQDQSFDLDRMDRRGADAGITVEAVQEGDANRTADRYRETLPRRQRNRSYDAGSDEIDAAAAAVDVPDALLLQEMVPYDLGPLMVQQAKSWRRGGVNGLFANPPATEAAFVTPWTFAQGTDVRPVAVPALAADETRVGRAERLDAYGLFLLLASRLGPDQALAAADRYGGDRWVLFDRDGVRCSRVAVRSNSRAGAPVLQRAVADWVATLPAGVASATSAGRSSTLTTCDDGTSAGPMPGGVEAAAAFVWDRNDNYAYLERSHPVGVARCAADRLVRDPVNATFSYSRTTRATAAEQDAFFARADELVEECGGSVR